jgi:hypothetical protein
MPHGNKEGIAIGGCAYVVFKFILYDAEIFAAVAVVSLLG